MKFLYLSDYSVIVPKSVFIRHLEYKQGHIHYTLMVNETN